LSGRPPSSYALGVLRSSLAFVALASSFALPAAALADEPPAPLPPPPPPPGAPIEAPGGAIVPPGQPPPIRPAYFYPLQPPPTYTVYKRANNGMFGGGMVIVAASLGAFIGGMIAIGAGAERITVFCVHPGSLSYPCEVKPDLGAVGGGIAAMILGVAGTVAGSWMISRGGKMVPTPYKPVTGGVTLTPRGLVF